MRWIMGYIECQVPGEHLERFMNLCRHHEIELWKVKEREKQAVFFMYAAEYSKLRPLARKTKTVPHIRKKCGFPFWCLKARRDWTFTWGIGLFFAVLYILSLFVWDIQFRGQQTYTKEGLGAEIEEMGVYRGMIRKHLQCDKIEQNLRLLHPDLSWVSAEEKGCVLQIQVKEGKMRKEKKETEQAVSLTAPCGGRIEAIVTRSGTPLCQKGDVVKKGQVLIQGSYDIVGDDEQIIRKQGVTADGEIRLLHTVKWEEQLQKEYIDKQMTGKKRNIYTFQYNDSRISLKNPLKWFDNSGNYDIMNYVCFEERFIPLQINVKIIRRQFLDYTKVKKQYTKEQAAGIFKKHLATKMEQMQNEGYEILEHTENMIQEENKYKITGVIRTCIETMNKKEVQPEELEAAQGKEETDGT